MRQDIEPAPIGFMPRMANGVSVRAATTAPLAEHRTAHCALCGMHQLCRSGDPRHPNPTRIGELPYVRRRTEHNDHLYRAGDAFRSLYVVRAGSFKTYLLNGDGDEQVMCFPMAGDMIGLDGIGTGSHRLHAVALEDSEVCVIQYADLERQAADMPALLHQLHKIMGRELAQAREVIMLLSYGLAGARVAAFLLDLSQRLTARGYPPRKFKLWMTRHEIGSYLGLRYETVSRTFSILQQQGLVTVRQKYVQLHDLNKLAQLVNLRGRGGDAKACA